MRQWGDLRGTTGILDFLAELTVDVDAIVDEANRWYQQASEAFERALKTEESARDKCVAALREAYETLPDFLGNFKDTAALLDRVDALQQEARQAADDPNTHLPGSGPKTDGIPKAGPDALLSQQLMRTQELCVFHLHSELARCRQRTARTRLVMRLVEHRSLRRSRQVLRVATACSTSARIFAWERLAAFCPADKVSQRPQCGVRVGARADRSSTASATYRQAVVVPIPKPAAS